MYILTLFPFLPALALAATHTITLGDDQKLAFAPDSVTAAVGDTLIFEFYPGGHSVAQSTFAAPCVASLGGIFSGSFNPPGPDDGPNVFEVTVTSTDPLWLFCAQIGHCNAGMVMVVNPPSSGNTLAAYKTAAASATLKAPTTVSGGVVKPKPADSGDNGSSSSSSESESSASSSAAAETSSSSAASTTPAASTTSSSAAAAAPPPSSASSSAIPTFTGAADRNVVGKLGAVVGGAVGIVAAIL